MEPWLIVVICVVAALVGGIAVLNRRARRMRQDNVDSQLARHGWSRTPADPSLVSRWRGEPFGQGGNPEATNVISGAYRDHRVLAFDHAADRRSQEGVVRDVHAVYAIILPAALPTLELRPEGLAGRVRDVLGDSDVKVGDDDFDQRFRVVCANAPFAGAVLSPAFRRHLLAAGRRSFRTENDTLLTWDFGPVDAYALTPNRLESQFDLLVNLVESVPKEVWTTYGSTRA